MSASSDIQQAVTGILRGAKLRVEVEILARREGNLASDIEAAVAQHGLCCFVLPPLPGRALTGGSPLFFPEAEVRVQIFDSLALNSTGADAYDLLDDILLALHWQPHTALDAAVQARMTAASEDLATATAWARLQPELAQLWALFDILSHPLYAASRPAEDSYDSRGRVRRVDAIFTAVYGLSATAS